jgi:hypothetical protein
MHGICSGRDCLETDFTIEQIGIEELKVPFRSNLSEDPASNEQREDLGAKGLAMHFLFW